MDEAGAMQMSEDQLLQYLLVQQVAEHSRLYNQSTAKPSRSSHLLANSYRSNVAQIPSDTHRSYHQSNVDDSHAELDTSFNSEGVASASDALINMRKPATQQSGAQPKDKSNSSHENASSEGVQANPTQVTALNPATQVTSTETTTQQMEVDVKVEAPVDQTVEPIQRLAPPRRMIIELRRRKRDSSDQHKE